MSDIIEEENTHGIGVPVRRREDLRFITGKGNYSFTGEKRLYHGPLSGIAVTRFRFSRTPTQNGFLACREAVC